jgi:aspartyl-tRNA(Asn)/glutamyl-tRNA(Gln) amidotransferase subunit A
MTMDQKQASIAQLLSAYADGSASPVEVMQMTLRAVMQLNPLINAFTVVDAQRALAAARESEARWRRKSPIGRLDGVPVSVKDTLMVQGIACRRGSLVTSELPAQESSPVVDNVVREGACVIGITTTPEYGSGAVTISPLTGITRNPWNLACTSGGSSGGAAAEIAARLSYGALATDAGGSARIPASLCGVPGFKPTGGTFPTYPANAAGTIASPGVIARTVRDIARLADVMAQPDARDAEMLPPSRVSCLDAIDNLRAQIGRAPRSVRIAFSTTMGYASRVHPEVAALVERAAAHLAELGFAVDEAHPGLGSPVEDFVTIFGAGTAYSASRLSDAQRAGLGEQMKKAVASGEKVTMQRYLAAQDARRATARALQKFHETYALLVTPTCAMPAFDAQLWRPPGFEEHEARAWTPFASLFNLTQQPAISVPCGLTSDGLPVGLQIAGPRFADLSVLSAAHWFSETAPHAIGIPPMLKESMA